MDISMMVSYAIYGVFALLAIIGLVAGISRGIRRQLIRTVTVAASAVIALVATLALKGSLLSAVEGKTLADLSGTAGMALPEGAWYGAIGADALKSLLALSAGVVLLPLIFVSLFVLISGIMLIVHKIICGIIGFTRKANSGFTRLLGMIVGAVQGAAVAFIIMLPVFSLVTSFSYTVGYTKYNYADKNNAQVLITAYDGYLCQVDDNIIYKLTYPVTEALSAKLATFDMNGDGEVTDARESLDTAVDVLVNIGELSATDWSKLNSNDKAALNKIVDSVSDDRLMAGVISGALSAFGEYITANGDIIPFEEPMKGFATSYLSVLATCDKDTLSADLHTTLDIYYLLSDSNALSGLAGGGELLSCFLAKDASGKTLYARLEATLDGNPRMGSVASAVNNLAVSMLLDKNNSDLTTDTAVEGIKEGITDTLAIDRNSFGTEEEYRASVSESLKATLDENHVQMTDEQLEFMTDYVINDMAGKSEVTDADLADFMSKYYEVYAE